MNGRLALSFALLLCAPLPASAETWMVKSSTLGCVDRDVLAAISNDSETGDKFTNPREGCVVLHSGERLLDVPGMAAGFDAYLKLERHDGSLVFVPSADVVADPGIGSVSDDR